MTAKRKPGGLKTRMDACVRLLRKETAEEIAADIGYEPRTVIRWWVELDPKDRAAVAIAARRLKLQEQYAQHSQMLAILQAELDRFGTKAYGAGRVSSLQLAAATAQDKIRMAEEELATLESKTGAGRKVRQKNSHKEG